jgi:hypothetical protein
MAKKDLERYNLITPRIHKIHTTNKNTGELTWEKAACCAGGAVLSNPDASASHMLVWAGVAAILTKDQRR